MKAAEDRHQRVYSEPQPPSSVASDAATRRYGDAEQQRVATALPDADAVGAIKTSPSPETDVALAAAHSPRNDAGNDKVSPFEGASSPKKPSRKGKVMLARDASGDGVAVLQDFLQEAGYNVGAVDGKFGKKTEDAVKKFQQDNGLTVDGLVGEEVAQKIIGMRKSERDLLRPLSGPDGTYDDKGGYVGSKGEDDFIRYLITDRPTMSASIPIGPEGLQGPAGLDRITKEVAGGITPDAARFLYQENMLTKDAFDRIMSAHGADGDGIAGGTL
jgi:hypothetical protein